MDTWIRSSPSPPADVDSDGSQYVPTLHGITGPSHSPGRPREFRLPRKPEKRPSRFALCMICDFFYPKLGGVEMHIWSLSQSLLQLGHKVVVITHAYKDRTGVRYMTNGLKVYYLPMWIMHDGCSMPSFYTMLPLLRQILVREKVDIVHGHQASSAMIHQCLMHANIMGYRTVYTDHSLFSFNDLAGIHLNKVLKMTLTGVDAAIGVSHTCRENLVLRASLEPELVSVIPNAVDCTKFRPDMPRRNAVAKTGKTNVVVLCRLNYRKGIDIIAEVIPIICQRHKDVNFIVGGDGPKKLLLEEMIERHDLHDRVELLGSVPHRNVPSVLNRGHVFLNCSLTESFCIAILEAAACGLYVVSTAVGGLPEVLPDKMITLAESVSSDSVSLAMEDGLSKVNSTTFTDPLESNKRVKKMYRWLTVAKRTVKVYERIMGVPKPKMRVRLTNYLQIGKFFGFLGIVMVALDVILLKIVSWLQPEVDIEHAPTFPVARYMKRPGEYHLLEYNRKQQRLSEGMTKHGEKGPKLTSS